MNLEEFGRNISSPLTNITFKSDLNLPITNNNYMTDNDNKTYCDESYIPLDRLNLSTVIGKGEFASVYKGINTIINFLILNQ